MPPSFLPDLSPAGARALAAATQRISAPAGARVIQAGQPAAGVYLVEAGVLRVFHAAPPGRTLYRLRPGDACVLALDCAFRGLRYPAHVEVEEDATIRVVPAATWRTLFEQEPAARAFTVDLLASWVFDLLGVLDTTVGARLPLRLADELVERLGEGDTVRCTHAELAAHLGTAREVVSRTLREWRAAGWVRTGRGWVQVPDAAVLLAGVEGGG